jgi:hypothetical protein
MHLPEPYDANGQITEAVSLLIRSKNVSETLGAETNGSAEHSLAFRVGTIGEGPHTEPKFLVLYLGRSKKLPGLRSVLHLESTPFWQRKSNPRIPVDFHVQFGADYSFGIRY